MASEGTTNLAELIRTMRPSLHAEAFVFARIPSGGNVSSGAIPDLATAIPTQMLFREAEGWTVITGQHVAEMHHLAFTFPCRMITLNVHSSLEAVGFLAAITKALASLQIGVNPVSGFFHDHLFVPVGREQEVMKALEAMSSGS